MKKLFLFAFLVCSLVSCREHADFDIESDIKQEKSAKETFAITPEQALENLSDFMNDAQHSTRSSKTPLVESITPIKLQPRMARGVYDNVDCENLLYVANFKDEKGYALLAGDERIGEKVIGITEQGNLKENTINQALELMTTDGQYLNNYPKTGPGFFTTPETGDEFFLNPNTAFSYNTERNDYLVGNFNDNEFEAENESGDDLDFPSNKTKLISSPELVTSTLSVRYAMDEIKSYNDWVATSKVAYNDQDPDMPAHSTSSNTVPFKYETKVSPWTSTTTYNILAGYRAWHQGDPFNKYYPSRRKYIVFGKKRKAPAGCFPLSIAKILTHFEHPKQLTYNNYTINWQELKRSFQQEKGANSAASLLRVVAIGCDSWHFYSGTFTFPADATSFMRGIGLSNAHSKNYRFTSVSEMIDKGCPVIIYAIPGINILNSHCWNIDGYKIKERTVTSTRYEKGKAVETSTRVEQIKMVHCDFGWGGKCNGYYIDGLFKLNDPSIEYDPGSGVSKNLNYNTLLKIITYEKP